MRDIDAALTSFLLDQTGLTAIAGRRIHASLSWPKGYVPAQGPLLLFNARGGEQDYSSLLLLPSYQFRSFASTEAEARQLDRALYDALNDAQCFPVQMARLESIGQLFQEPDTGWPFVLSYYRIIFAN